MFKIVGRLVLISLIAPNLIGCSNKEADRKSPVERGKYLLTLGGCHGCHTPKVPGSNGEPLLDTAQLLSGHPANLPPAS